MVEVKQIFSGKSVMEDYSSCDMDDDWFYESLTRYNTLQIFYLQNVPEHVLQIDDWTLCVAGRNQKSKRVELLELKLPVKLTLPAEDKGRSKENDFKMLSGLYVNQSIHQMGALREDRKIITSEENKYGFNIYSFYSDGKLVTKQENQVFPAEGLMTPNFTVEEVEKRIACSTCNHKPLIICDINSEKVIKELEYPFYETISNCLGVNNDVCSLNSVTCELLGKNIIAVLDVKTGVIALIDLRTENTISLLETPDNGGELWTLSRSDYKTSLNYFGALSNKGNLSLYDLRNNNKSVKSECFSFTVDNIKVLKLKIANRERFSISGVDSNIYVYNILRSECELAFTHNGHCQKFVSNEVENLINDHIWLPSIGGNFVLSICNNRSLNCWEYNQSAM